MARDQRSEIPRERAAVVNEDLFDLDNVAIVVNRSILLCLPAGGPARPLRPEIRRLLGDDALLPGIGEHRTTIGFRRLSLRRRPRHYCPCSGVLPDRPSAAEPDQCPICKGRAIFIVDLGPYLEGRTSGSAVDCGRRERMKLNGHRTEPFTCQECSSDGRRRRRSRHDRAASWEGDRIDYALEACEAHPDPSPSRASRRTSQRSQGDDAGLRSIR